MDAETKKRIRNGIFGLLIGDALGVPYEFHPPEEIPAPDQIEMQPPQGFSRSYPEVPPGTWSDDGAQALCLLDSLLSAGGFDLADFADRLLAWVDRGLWAVDGRVFDCGIQTMQSLRAYAMGTAPEKAGMVVPDGKGNGALMRVLPMALFLHCSQSDEETIAKYAQEQALITHGHVCNQVCCALYCLWADGLLAGGDVAASYRRAARFLETHYHNQPDYLYELECCLAEGEPTGTGYVVDSIRSARYLLQRYDSYEGVVKGAVQLGNDTDTTAAIAGGLAGIAYGHIPARWTEQLRGKELVEPLLEKLLQQ